MTYISTRGESAEADDVLPGEITQTNDILKLGNLDINERYLEFISGTCSDADEYMSAYMCSYALNEIACIGMTRKHGLHDQLNAIITRLNEMEKLLAAIARNTQCMTCKKSVKE